MKTLALTAALSLAGLTGLADRIAPEANTIATPAMLAAFEAARAGR
jgi:hypothetical protein